MKEIVASLKKNITPVQVIQICVTLIGFGVAIARMEYQFNTKVDEIKNLVTGHIIESQGKEALFRSDLMHLTEKVNESISVQKILGEFIRPDDVTIRRRR